MSEEIWKKMKADSKQRFEFNTKLLKPKRAGRPCGNALGYTLRNGATDWSGLKEKPTHTAGGAKLI